MFTPVPREKFDTLQIAALVGLMCLGAAFVFSATMVSDFALSQPWYQQSWVRQIIWYALGTGVAAALCVVDYHSLARWSFVVYWVTIIFLVAVLIPHIGSMRFGARRWIDLGFFQFQPSEFAKLAFILAAANFLSRPTDELKQLGVFWKGIGLMMLPFVLILKEPDLGSALVLLPTGLVMMFAAGTPKKYLVILISTVSVLAILFLADLFFAPLRWQVPMQEYQRNRLLVYFGRDYTHFAPLNATPAELQRLKQRQLDDAYNVRQADRKSVV